jgi:hypothetical protein
MPLGIDVPAIIAGKAGAASAPWWATPLVAGAFALLGVAIAQFITISLERRRNRRDDQRRLDTALRTATLEYLDALQSYATFVTSLTVGRVLITGQPGIVGVEDEFSRWSAKARAIDSAGAQLGLAAQAELLAVANEVHEPINRFNIAAQGGPMTERLKYGHADEVYSLIPRLRNAVRMHLGLDSLPNRNLLLLNTPQIDSATLIAVGGRPTAADHLGDAHRAPGVRKQTGLAEGYERSAACVYT